MSIVSWWIWFIWGWCFIALGVGGALFAVIKFMRDFGSLKGTFAVFILVGAFFLTGLVAVLYLGFGRLSGILIVI